MPSANTLVRWVNETAFASIVQARPCPTFGRPVHRRGSPHRLRPGTSPHALRIPPRDGHPALRSSNFALRPASRYSRFWIWRPSSEHQRDFNPPEQCAAQRTLQRSPTSPTRTCPHCGLRPSRTGLPQLAKACWRSPGSRACCFISVRGFLDYAGPDRHSRVTQPPYCLPPTRKRVGILIFRLFEAQWPGPPIPLSTLQGTPRDVPSKTRGQDGFATSFPAGDLHPLQHAGLSPRSPVRRLFVRKAANECIRDLSQLADGVCFLRLPYRHE